MHMRTIIGCDDISAYLPDVCCPPYVWADIADIESPGCVEQGHVLEQHCSSLLPLALRDGLGDVLRALCREALPVHISQRIGNLACAGSTVQAGSGTFQKPPRPCQTMSPTAPVVCTGTFSRAGC